MTLRLVIGSRGSKLALAQANLISNQLRVANPQVVIDIEVIKTTGDMKSDPLSVIGGKGVFTKELEEALLDRRIDIAVHSLKDLPTVIPDNLRLGAVCEREDPRDALVLGTSARAVSIRALKAAAMIGTSSPRRAAQLKFLRPDLMIKELRGNIDTRLRKLDEGHYDALVVAAAGLRRLSLTNRISCFISTDDMLPAVSQGAIGLETRVDDKLANDVVTTIDHSTTRLACNAERAFLRALGGGCQLPIAGHATIQGNQIYIEGLVADPSGAELIREKRFGPAEFAEEIGRDLGISMLDHGARSLLSTSTS